MVGHVRHSVGLRMLRTIVLLCGAVVASGVAESRPADTQSNRFETGVGYFSLVAHNSAGDKTIANLGLYQFAFRLPVFQHTEFTAGYSLYVLGAKKLDLGFGPDLGARFYPLTRPGPTSVNGENVRIDTVETYRPYVALTFHQRQYQSVQSSFAGMSLGLGIDWSATERLTITTAAKIMALKGPLESRIREQSIVVGLSTNL